MHFSSKTLVLAASALWYAGGISAAAVSGRHLSHTLYRREDVSDDPVADQSTEKLRNCKPPGPVYDNPPGDKVPWFEVSDQTSLFEKTKETDKGKGEVPKTNDERQGPGFVVDHTFELQVVVYAFDGSNRKLNDKAKKISDKGWEKAHNAVNGDDSSGCNKVADKVTVLENLKGIGNRVNVFKEQAFIKATSGAAGPKDGKWKKSWIDAVVNELVVARDDVRDVIANIGDVLNDICGDKNVKDYFVDYATKKYDEARGVLANLTPGNDPEKLGSGESKSTLDLNTGKNDAGCFDGAVGNRQTAADALNDACKKLKGDYQGQEKRSFCVNDGTDIKWDFVLKRISNGDTRAIDVAECEDGMGKEIANCDKGNGGRTKYANWEYTVDANHGQC